MSRTSMLAALGALALVSVQPVYAATTSEAASSWADQFSGERGASVHIPTQGGMLSDPARDYVHSLQSTFRAEKRAGMNDAGYDGFQSYVSQFN